MDESVGDGRGEGDRDDSVLLLVLLRGLVDDKVQMRYQI